MLIEGRDDEFHRWLGDGSPSPAPTACIEVDGEIVGWVDFDRDQPWLLDDEVNVGYNAFAPFRGRGYVTRAVALLAGHLADHTRYTTLTLLIDERNHRSLAVAHRLDFGAGQRRPGQPPGQRFFIRPAG